MRLARELINLPVYSIDGGQEIGKVKDLYFDDRLRQVTAINLGSDGLLNRSECFIRQADVITLGQDAILVQSEESVLDEAETPELEEWLKRWKRRDDLRGREVSTPGGTKIGRLGDIILDEEAKIAGFSLSQTFVTGPVAENKAVSRSAMIESVEGIDGVIGINLAKAEKDNLRVGYDSLLSSEPTVSTTGQPEEMKANA